MAAEQHTSLTIAGHLGHGRTMMFGGLHAGSWEILIIPVVMMLLFAVI